MCVCIHLFEFANSFNDNTIIVGLLRDIIIPFIIKYLAKANVHFSMLIKGDMLN